MMALGIECGNAAVNKQVCQSAVTNAVTRAQVNKAGPTQMNIPNS